MIKKLGTLLLTFLVVLPFYIVPEVKAAGRTLQDLINQLTNLENKLNATEEEQKLTAAQIEQLKNNIIQIGKDITTSEDTVVKINEEMELLNKEIDQKEIEIKKLISFLQVTSGESFYLEYAFGAKTMADLIYRTSVVEQMTAYNDQLIASINQSIEEKKQKQQELEEKKKELQIKKNELLKQQEELGSKMNLLDEDARDIKIDIQDAKKTIANYQNMGCKPNEELSSCGMIPAGTSFLRPLTQGTITSGYGLRDLYDNGNWSWHYAIDIGGNAKGTPVYAAAEGRVVLIVRPETPWIPNSSCGGNYVVIQHLIKGQYYATRYMHLNSISVNVNQTVTMNTQVGTVGGGEAYDYCTTGPHLDFSMAKGVYADDFYSFREPYTFNPVTAIKFPPLGTWFSGRY